jgi:hypothetical protein
MCIHGAEILLSRVGEDLFRGEDGLDVAPFKVMDIIPAFDRGSIASYAPRRLSGEPALPSGNKL